MLNHHPGGCCSSGWAQSSLFGTSRTVSWSRSRGLTWNIRCSFERFPFTSPGKLPACKPEDNCPLYECDEDPEPQSRPPGSWAGCNKFWDLQLFYTDLVSHTQKIKKNAACGEYKSKVVLIRIPAGRKWGGYFRQGGRKVQINQSAACNSIIIIWTWSVALDDQTTCVCVCVCDTCSALNQLNGFNCDCLMRERNVR